VRAINGSAVPLRPASCMQHHTFQPYLPANTYLTISPGGRPSGFLPHTGQLL